MNGIIVGAGEVGFHIADRLSREGHNIVVIEQDAERERLLTSKVNALVVHGSG
ncbi:MAG: NAD(P)-binding domain-containing protein, partial [Gemmatimonadetes bacterium]|nr:NAD(P)-binding domain-containing protein [Gemmatimonadota bacterium]